jgi:hypothetical protein
MLRTSRSFGLPLVLLLSAVPANAQARATTADLGGIVYDQTQAVLPAVELSATNTENGITRSVLSGEDGRFVFPALPPGVYIVRAQAPGFAPLIQESIVLAVGAVVELEVRMALAGIVEQVRVTGDPPLVDTQRTAIATAISRQQIENLPINGRNFISFSILTPGATTDRTPQQGAAATSGLTFAGQRARSNNITVDGVDNNDAALGAIRATFSQDAVREFQVLTNSYPAEFGKASGGVVNIVTRSGTNQLTGSTFFYFRNEALNSKEHFERYDPSGSRIDRQKAPYGQKQFGGTLGGPIARDRTFYFLSFERLDIDANNFVTIDDQTQVTLGPTPLGTPKQILERAGFPIETGNVPYQLKTSTFLAKIDQHLSSGHDLTARFNYADTLNENIEPWGGQIARSRGAFLDSKDYMIAAGHTFLASEKLLNELRFQYARRDQDVNSLDPLCGGPCVLDDQGGPTVEVTGFAQVGRQRFTPQPRHSRRWQVLDALTYYAGDHQFKGGFDTSIIQNKNEALPLHFGGRYIFAAALPGALLGLPVPTINAIQAVALGVPAAYVQGYGVPRTSYTVSDTSLFVQDDWRMGRDFVLKLGVRYQRQFWPDTLYRAPGLDSYDFPDDSNNLAPRIAFAWDPWGRKRTSIRAGYGVFFENHMTALNGITDLIDGSDTGVRTLVAQLPNPLPIAAWNAPGRRLPESSVGAFPSLIISIDPALRTPYAHHASIGVEQEVAPRLALSASVVYANGHAQLGTIDYNPLVTALGPGRRPDDIDGRAGTSASVLQFTSFGQTWYRGLTVALNRPFDGRYQVLASYTLSKAEDHATDYQTAFIVQDSGRGRDPMNPRGLPLAFNPDIERGRSAQDQRHRLVLSGTYALPAAVQLSTIFTAGSGRPYTILAGADLNGDGNGGAFPPDRARTNPNDASSAVGRNTATLPRQLTLDVRASRRIRFGEQAYLEGIVEGFNLFNRTNYTEINNIFGTGVYPTAPLSTFGQFTQAGPPRQVQLALRLAF